MNAYRRIKPFAVMGIVLLVALLAVGFMSAKAPEAPAAAPAAQATAAPAAAGPTPTAAPETLGCVKHMQDGTGSVMTQFMHIRGMRYCEISLLCSPYGSTMYNTTSLNTEVNPNDSCPSIPWNGMSETTVAQMYGAPSAWKNGRRGWTPDWINLPVGTELDFQGTKARWFAYPQYPPNVATMGITAGSWKPSTIQRSSTMGFDANTPIFTLTDPQGNAWVMQAWDDAVKPLTYNSLFNLNSLLTPPAGWSYQVITITQPLQIQAVNGLATVTQDNLGNSYDECSPGACSYDPVKTAPAATKPTPTATK